jgi:hypothetical protein
MSRLAEIGRAESLGSPLDGLLDIDPTLCQADYNRRPFLFRHRLSVHPLMQLDSLVELACRLSPSDVLHCRGRKPIGTGFHEELRARAHRLSLPEVLEDMENADAYVYLHGVESDPAYGDLVNELLDEIRPLVEPLDPEICDVGAYIFIMSPGGVTPYHMDDLANFLCQIRGPKVMQLWDPADRSIMAERDFENLCARPLLPKPPYKPDYAAKAMTFELRPGLGLHHPFFAPHAAQGADGISIAMAVAFRSKAMQRRMMVHRANHVLRRVGLRLQPFGDSPWLDSLKYHAFRTWVEARSRVRSNYP